MHPIISIVGRSESGKTTLLEGLIAELKRRGHCVAVIKHSAENAEVDTVNKDTWRFTRAGSAVSAIVSGRNLGIFKKLDADFAPEEISPLVPECDLIITEGFKRSSYPKIEVHRKAQGHDLVSPPEQLLAVVTDERLEVSAPQFSKENVKEIADLVEQRIQAEQRSDRLALRVDGAEARTTAALRDVLSRSLMAMVPLVKDSREVKELNVLFRRKRA